MQQILDFITDNWVAWLFAGGWALSKINLKRLKKKMQAEELKNRAIAIGVQGYMPIYARESLKKIYEAYQGLGGNDVAHDLYEKMRHWGTDPEEREEE